jgi:multidrug resistance efflux pump
MGRMRLRNSRLFLRVLPVIVWLGAVASVVGLFHRRSARFEIVGIAQPQVRQVAATCDGRLISVPVQLFDKVKKDDIVAELTVILDDEHIDAQVKTIEAQMDHIEAQLRELRRNYEAEIFNRRSEWWAEMRAFMADVVTSRLRIFELNATIEHDKTVRANQDHEIKAFTRDNQGVLDTDIKKYYELQSMKANRATVDKKIKENEKLLVKYQKELDEAMYRKEVYDVNFLPAFGTEPNEAQDVIRKAKAVLQRQMEELLARREKLVLKAPCDGYISQIPSRPGEAVMQGAEILRIAEENTRVIIAYADEGVVGQLATGKEVEIVKDSEPEQIAWSQISYIGPAVEQLPQRLWRNPNFPQWGRPMLIDIPPGMTLIPGELVGIRGL